jgi:hypothetical protein
MKSCLKLALMTNDMPPTGLQTSFYGQKINIQDLPDFLDFCLIDGLIRGMD